MSNENTSILFDILASRHSTRNFSSESVDKNLIEQIATTGMLAPFGSATGLTLEQTRRIFIISPDSKIRRILEAELQRILRTSSMKLGIASKFVPMLRFFYQRVKQFADHGIPALSQHTYWVLISEKKGFPPVTKSSMAHALQNMWLAATVMGLGFQLLSASSLLVKSKQIRQLLELEPDEFDLDGCVIGTSGEISTVKQSFKQKDFTSNIIFK